MSRMLGYSDFWIHPIIGSKYFESSHVNVTFQQKVILTWDFQFLKALCILYTTKSKTHFTPVPTLRLISLNQWTISLTFTTGREISILRHMAKSISQSLQNVLRNRTFVHDVFSVVVKFGLFTR